MKKRFLVYLLPALIGCSGDHSEDTTSIVSEKSEDVVDKIHGIWQLDSSAFVDQTGFGAYSDPLMPTTWSFLHDGSYQVKNSVTMHGSFDHQGDSLFVVLMDVPNEYAIHTLNETQLVLETSIIETDSTSMKTVAYLTRIIE